MVSVCTVVSGFSWIGLHVILPVLVMLSRGVPLIGSTEYWLPIFIGNRYFTEIVLIFLPIFTQALTF